MSTSNLLTIIIPFLNERYEVENTLKSIKEHSTGNITVILINDASDDGFDYRRIAEKYDTLYIENPKRIGVAASRDAGVDLCKTPYFLFLDAHMRFYDKLWINRIVSELKADKRVLLCCQTKSLNLEDGLLISNKSTTYGAYIEFHDGTKMIEPYWISCIPFNETKSNTVPIVCILGAGYACTKEYWQYLKGLNGLQYYGSDQPYISMKIWLEGGSCKLLTDVVIGHIYRKGRPPYIIQSLYQLYNKLLITTLLIPPPLKKELFSKARYIHNSVYSKALLMLYDKSDIIVNLKAYYDSIFTRDFKFVYQLNNECHQTYKMKDKLVDGLEKTLYDIQIMIKERSCQDMGILRGNMGATIFLFHYSNFINNASCLEDAETRLNFIIQNIKNDTHYGFCTGLSGIGWGIEYLYQNGFITGNINHILADFDKKIMEINPRRIVCINRDYGLASIVLYLLARLYSIQEESLTSPFDEDYLASIYDRVKEIIKMQDISCDGIDVFLDFLNFYEKKQKIDKPEIYDVCSMINFDNIPLQDMNIGIRGISGIGLKLILEDNNELKEIKNGTS